MLPKTLLFGTIFILFDSFGNNIHSSSCNTCCLQAPVDAARKAGVRLGDRLGIETSRNTTLRRIMDLPDEARASVVYLGIDDFAFRRGYQFGTILVDLESHRVVDILPDRRAETSVAWMRENPEIHVVSRDRASAYASAVSEAAPQ